MKWGTIYLLLPVELPFVDGTKAVTEIRGPHLVTCVCLRLGSPCFNKHLDAERGPTSLTQTHSLTMCTAGEHCVFVTACLTHRHALSASHRCISALPARLAWLACRPGPRFTALTQESIKGCLGIPGPSPSEISFIIAPSYHARGAARPISRAATCVRG